MRRRAYLYIYLSLLAPVLIGTADAYPTSVPFERSRTIVYINGAKFYIHTVQTGETLYSIAKAYGIDEGQIIAHNRSAADGLKQDQTIKIPVVAGANPTDNEPKKRRKDYEFHTVAAGETLYSVSRRYAVSIDTIIDDNPDIDPTQLSIGTRLYIRKSEIGHTHETQVRNEWEEYKNTLNSVAPDGYTYYIVQAGDTIYSLCKRFSTTEDVIASLNDMSEGLKSGTIIKLPRAAAPPETGFSSADTDRRTGNFKAVNAQSPLRAVLMLPMTKHGETNNNYLDFYRGFLSGLDRVKKEGYSVELTLFDTEHNPEKVSEIVGSDFGGSRPDIIIGPVYEAEIAKVTEYAESNDIPVVSPLASLSSIDSRVLFQMSPAPNRKYDKVGDLFDGRREVTLIYGESNDAAFEQEILALLNGQRFATHKYAYEHPSVIEQREKERARLGIKTDEPLSPSDMTPLLRGSKNNVFVILSDNETEVGRILAAIASANISLTARERTVSHFTVFGNSKWNRYANIDRSIFFQNRVTLMSSYHSHGSDERVKAFDRRYIAEFGAIPSLYTYRGYDAAVIFCLGMFSDISNGLADKRYTPLQTPYAFARPEGRELNVNNEWVRINYNNDFTVSIE